MLGGTWASSLKSDVTDDQIFQVLCDRWDRMACLRQKNLSDREKIWNSICPSLSGFAQRVRSSSRPQPSLGTELRGRWSSLGFYLFLKNMLQNLHLNPWIQQEGGYCRTDISSGATAFLGQATSEHGSTWRDSGWVEWGAWCCLHGRSEAPLSAPRAGIPDAFKAEQTPVGRFSKPEASATADCKLLHLTHLETKPDAALNVAQHRRRQRLVVVGISFRTGKLVWSWSSVEVIENTQQDAMARTGPYGGTLNPHVIQEISLPNHRTVPISLCLWSESILAEANVQFRCCITICHPWGPQRLAAQRLPHSEPTHHRDSWPKNILAAFSRCNKPSWKPVLAFPAASILSLLLDDVFVSIPAVCRLCVFRPPAREICHSCHLSPANQNLLLEPGLAPGCVPSPSVSAGSSSDG